MSETTNDQGAANGSGELWERAAKQIDRLLPPEAREYAPRAFLFVAVAMLAAFVALLFVAVGLRRFAARWDAVAPWIALGVSAVGVACLVVAAVARSLDLAIAALLLLLVALGIGIGPKPGPVLWAAAALAVVSVAAILAVIHQALRVVNKATNAQAAEARKSALEKFGKADDLSGRIAANQEVRSLWEGMARRQASSSYTYSQIALAAGLVVLLVGTVAVFLVGDFASQAVIGGLAAIGGAISGYIARTYLVVYRDAQQQLNFYFVEPLVTSYLLTAERLAEKVKNDGVPGPGHEGRPTEGSDLAQEIYREIATSVLRTSGESVWVAGGRRDATTATTQRTGEAS